MLGRIGDRPLPPGQKKPRGVDTRRWIPEVIAENLRGDGQLDIDRKRRKYDHYIQHTNRRSTVPHGIAQHGALGGMRLQSQTENGDDKRSGRDERRRPLPHLIPLRRVLIRVRGRKRGPRRVAGDPQLGEPKRPSGRRTYTWVQIPQRTINLGRADLAHSGRHIRRATDEDGGHEKQFTTPRRLGRPRRVKCEMRKRQTQSIGHSAERHDRLDLGPHNKREHSALGRTQPYLPRKALGGTHKFH